MAAEAVSSTEMDKLEAKLGFRPLPGTVKVYRAQNHSVEIADYSEDFTNTYVLSFMINNHIDKKRLVVQTKPLVRGGYLMRYSIIDSNSNVIAVLDSFLLAMELFLAPRKHSSKILFQLRTMFPQELMNPFLTLYVNLNARIFYSEEEERLYFLDDWLNSTI